MIASYPYSLANNPINTDATAVGGGSLIFRVRIMPLLGDYLWIRYAYSNPSFTNTQFRVLHRIKTIDGRAVIKDLSFAKTPSGGIVTTWDTVALDAVPTWGDLSGYDILYEMHAYWSVGTARQVIAIYSPELGQNDGSEVAAPGDMLWPGP